jgi:hypothetical protein
MNKIFFFAGAAVAAAVLAGCAAMEASNQESLMAAAGFRERVPQTAKQQAIYEQMPAYQVQSMPVGDQIVYLYKDPKQGVVYYGGEAEYGRYKQLALQQSISDQQMMAAQLNQQTAMMYAGWGPWGLWY